TAHVWKYSISGNSWTAGPNLPSQRGAGAAAIIGRELHFFGGSNLNRTQDSSDHWVLNLDNPTSWTAKAALLNPRNHMAAVALDGLIYAIGGQHLENEVNGNQATVNIYIPTTETWTNA